MKWLDWTVASGWLFGNTGAIYALAFTEITWLRVLGWLWLSAALSLAGVFEIGYLSGPSQRS
jgi:hypothetical protein